MGGVQSSSSNNRAYCRDHINQFFTMKDCLNASPEEAEALRRAAAFFGSVGASRYLRECEGVLRLT